MCWKDKTELQIEENVKIWESQVSTRGSFLLSHQKRTCMNYLNTYSLEHFTCGELRYFEFHGFAFVLHLW